MTSVDVLGLVLKHLTSTCSLKDMCQIFAQSPAVVSRNINKGMELLLVVVSTDQSCKVEWPSPGKMQEFAQLITDRHPELNHVFGFVDGVYFPMFDPADSDIQNAFYNGWKAMCSVTNVIVFSPEGCIIWASFNYPGSWHDAKVARSLYDLMVDPIE